MFVIQYCNSKSAEIRRRIHLRFKFIFLSMLILFGISQDSYCITKLLFPLSASSTSDTLNGIIYTFAVSQDTLGIFDSLNMTLTAHNQTSQNDTIPVNDGLYTWKLENDNGKTIITGPWFINNLVQNVIINPNQTDILYNLDYSMADIFKSPIEPGTYSLTWKLWNGLSFQLNLVCGRSKNEIEDSIGISSPIYSLRVSNIWKYSTFDQFPNTVIQGDTVTQTVVGEELLNGEKWFLIQSGITGDQLMTVRQDGIYIQESNGPILRYKYPAYSNEQFNSAYELWTGYADSLVAFPITVDSINELISTPSGTFQCNKYHFPEVIVTVGNSSTEVGSKDIYLSNIGPVKIVAGNSYQDLISFSGTITDISNSKNSIPESFHLYQNYPNPFNPSTTINYSIPNTSFVTIKVYDMLGREVASLVDENKSAGNYNIKFNAGKLSSGVYFYQLKSGNYTSIKKMLLLK